MIDRTDVSVDVFIHTWNYDYIFPDINQKILSVYKPKAVVIQPPVSKSLSQKYQDPDPPRYTAYSNYSHYMSIWRCEELKRQYEIDNEFFYDWVVKTRFDVALNTYIDFHSLDSSCLYISDFDINDYEQNGGKIKSDALAVGNSHTARMYASVAQHMDELYEQMGSIDGHGMFGAVIRKYGMQNYTHGLCMNHPFGSGEFDCAPNSFIRSDFSCFSGK
jgi:hypothetical protein